DHPRTARRVGGPLSQHRARPRERQALKGDRMHQPMEGVHIDERQWETLRWPGQWSKMLFHPRPKRPTEPNAGLVRYDPGSHHPWHRHDFAQVWYILHGEFAIAHRVYGPGTMMFYPDPPFDAPLRTEPGGTMLFLQHQEP